MLFRVLRHLSVCALLGTFLTTVPGLASANEAQNIARDLQRAVERAFKPDSPRPANPKTGGAADTRRTEDLPPSATNFQACASHFSHGAAPVVEDGARYGTLRALCYDRFAVLHSAFLKGPLFSAQRLSAADLRAGADVKRPDGRKAFFSDARLPMKERAQLGDYAGESRLPKDERHDRGHLSPARDMTDDRSMAQSFSLANVVPQNSINNQQVWNKIEKDTRAYVMRARGSVTIITGAQYDARPERLGSNGPAIPTAMYKLVFDETTGRAWAHWLPNTATARVGRPISYDELVRRTGIRFLPQAPVLMGSAE